MMKYISFFATACFAVALLAGCGEDKTTTPHNDTISAGKTDGGTTAAAEGKTVYESKCTMCHGGDGKAGIMGAADLSASKLDHATTITIIANGKNAMKSFSGELSEAEIEAVAKYVEELRK